MNCRNVENVAQNFESVVSSETASICCVVWRRIQMLKIAAANLSPHFVSFLSRCTTSPVLL